MTVYTIKICNSYLKIYTSAKGVFKFCRNPWIILWRQFFYLFKHEDRTVKFDGCKAILRAFEANREAKKFRIKGQRLFNATNI